MAKKYKLIRRLSPIETAKKKWRKIKWIAILSGALAGVFFLVVLISSLGIFMTGLVTILARKNEDESYNPSFGVAGKAKNLSEKVLSLSGEIEEEAERQGIREYAEVLKAIMMVESGGEPTIEDFPDVMGSAESPFNTRYPGMPGAIRDYKYSIEVGTKTLAYMVKKLECSGPGDVNMLKNSLQSYNCGEQFYFWMVEQYGDNIFSVDRAYAYSASHNDAGQPEYIPRIMEFYTFGGTGGAGGGAVPSKGQFYWPLDPPYGTNALTSDYGARYHPITGEYSFHNGVDIGADGGTPIYAAAAGTVIISGWHDSYGNWVMIDHGNGWSTLYAHQSQRNCVVGDQVSVGQVIGFVGTTGDSTGNHLHFEVRQPNNTTVNPLNYFE